MPQDNIIEFGKPQFVSGDMFLAYTGMDLASNLRNNDNVSNKVNTFLFRVEERLKVWIDKHTFRVRQWNELTPFQTKYFRLAILEQAQYMWKNGDLSLDSGYDQNSGQIVDPRMLEEIEVCRPAINFLIEAGLFNLKVINRKRWISGDALGVFEGGTPLGYEGAADTLKK